MKGALTGGIMSGLFIWLFSPSAAEALLIAGAITAGSSFLAMNFTGASTFTSPSGVKKEMRYALPFQIGLLCTAAAARILLPTVLPGGAGL